METREYYRAYDDRYRQVHQQNLRWFTEAPSPIVGETIAQFGIRPDQPILEIGCGEGRDAGFLLNGGYNILATDISPNAVSFCRRDFPQWAERFQVLDCVSQRLDTKFDFIYAVAVIHMLVKDAHRDGFYRFIREQLTVNGIALIGTMGDGQFERASDIANAFDLQERTHEQTGQTVYIASTSCRIVSFATFREELSRNGLAIVKEGMTAIEPDFPRMMYAIVKRA